MDLDFGGIWLRLPEAGKEFGSCIRSVTVLQLFLTPTKPHLPHRHTHLALPADFLVVLNTAPTSCTPANFLVFSCFEHCLKRSNANAS